MVKHSGIKLTAIIVAVVLILPGFLLPAKGVSASLLKPPRVYLLSDEKAAESWLSCGAQDVVYRLDLGCLESIAGIGCELTVSAPANGDYQIMLEYTSGVLNLFENTALISVNGMDAVCALPLLWADVQGEVQADRYGNEVVPEQVMLSQASSAWLEDYEKLSRVPILFPLAAGDNQIKIIPQNQNIYLISAIVVRPAPVIDYRGYRALYADAIDYGDIIITEGENHRLKSDSYIRGRSVASTGVVPNDPYVKLINAIDDKSYKTAGQKLLYEIDIPADGWYTLTVKYCQPLKAGGVVYRTVEVDGAIPFAEAMDVAFSHTGMNKYKNRTLDHKFYLTEGIHTIAFKVTAGPADNAVTELLCIINEINDTGVVMRKIKGSNSDDTARIDVNRTWDIIQYMPDILDDMERWRGGILAVYGELKTLSGAEPSYAGDLKLAAQNLARLISEPREIPNRSSLLSDGSGSAAQLASGVLQKLLEQNLSIDRFYLHGEDIEPPSPDARFWKSVMTAIRQFYYSFTPVMNDSTNISNSGEILTVWVGKPSQYVEALRTLTAQDFTVRTGIDVVFSIMPDEKRITLANSTGSNPDVALSLSYYRPAEFAMRGMAMDLLQFDDFPDWYGNEYNIASLAPMAYEDGVFGASETQEFYVMFYRRDILEALGLEVPDTWDDVRRMMPTLLRNSMNFNHPLANNVGYKSFESTGMFIFQNGGDYYSTDGLTANFNDPATLRGLREMTDLFITYGMAQNVPSFFNAFRSGSIPIGIGNFSTYLQLQVAAPELAGRWDIAPVPGTVWPDGETRRYYSADNTSAMIFSNSKMKEEAYGFLKWWLSGETQIKYSQSLQIKYGPDFVWNTGNHTAFSQMPYPLRHKEIILEQWQWQREALRHPASYILEREVSNAWIDIVTKGMAFQPRIDDATLAANREMRRKLIEFGYLDQRGNRLKEYNIGLIDELIASRKGVADGE